MTTTNNASERPEQLLWHTLSAEEIRKLFGVSMEGLSPEEAITRLQKYGANTLPSQKLITIGQFVLGQLKNPLIFILVIAAIAALVIGEYADTGFIAVVIVINTALGTFQEYNAQKSANELQKMLKIKAHVKRNGHQLEIDSEEVVPGDVVMLESGMKVPADLRLVEAHNLTSDESFLTGESIPASKSTEALEAHIVVNEMVNMAFAGATINTGRGAGIVVATGKATEVGRIAESVTESEIAKPPLVMRMEKFSLRIGLAVVGVSVIIAILLSIQGYDAASIFFFIVALTVSAIPEGLPVAVTIALSVASKRMSKRNVIARKLTSVETLGSCTVIASDKTGTLTVNEQTARIIALPDGGSFRITGVGYHGNGEIETKDGESPHASERGQLTSLLTASVLTNEGILKQHGENWSHQGDAMDVAFLAATYKFGLDPDEIRNKHKILADIPYESELKFSAAFYQGPDALRVAVKGAVETILEFCSKAYATELDKFAVIEEAAQMASKGYRVLAVAGGPVQSVASEGLLDQLQGLELYGLVGFIDPLRTETADAIRRSQTAGINVIMITGDHPFTARAIADELGLITPKKPNVVTGEDAIRAKAVSDKAFVQMVRSANVFARVSPIQKLEIVDALIDSGEFVAVTGDGVNDTPALRRANIGVAMGSGSDAAKEVGSMIIVDDNFSSIVAGVEEGRYAYDNVRKVIYLLVSTGAAEVILFISCVILQLPMPLLAVQILWLNLVTNGIQHVALSLEGGEPGAMKRKPRRPSEPIFNLLMLSQTLISGFAMGLITLAAWYWLVEVHGASEPVARNIVLMLFVLLQNMHVFNCRSERNSIFSISLGRNPYILWAVLGAQGIHIASMNLPLMQSLLSIQPVEPMHWVYLLGSASIVLLAMELFKWLNKKLLHIY